jgi:hypothetical protein
MFRNRAQAESQMLLWSFLRSLPKLEASKWQRVSSVSEMTRRSDGEDICKDRFGPLILVLASGEKRRKYLLTPKCHHWLCPLTKGSTFLEKRENMRKNLQRAPVAHICNPSYSGGRDQEDCGSKPAQGNSSGDPISKIANTKKGWWSGSRCRP